MTQNPRISVVVLFGGFLAAAWLVSPGFFNIDEFIYFAGAQAVASGDWVVANSAEGLQSRQLNLWLLVDGPNGLVPQYPMGTALAGGLLLATFGLPGLIILNAVAAAGVVFVTFRIASRHFGGKNVAIGAAALMFFASFFLEFAFAVWPHAVAMLAVLLAVMWMFDSLESDLVERNKMLGIGVVLGLGMAFRTDVAVAVVAIGLCLFLWSKAPVARLVYFVCGLLPFLIGLAAVNFQKFGVLNPVSYGQTHSGGTNLTSHLFLLSGLAVAGLAALGLRMLWSKGLHRKPLLVLGGIAGAALILLAHKIALSYLHGFWALTVDATAIVDDRSGIETTSWGTISFWGYWKKALGQSMPWLGLVLASCFGAQHVNARTLQVCLVMFLVWGLPFFPRDWHGGMGSNMRYFLPLIPLCCALAASLICDLWQRTPQAFRVFVFSLVGGAILTVAWALFHGSGAGGAHQIMPTYVVLATAGAALLAGYKQFENRAANITLMSLTGLGVGIAGQLALTDFRMAQEGRESAMAYSEAHAALPDRALAFVPSRFLVGWALQDGHLAALPNDRNGRFDTGLIDEALGQGYRVFIWPNYLNQQLIEDQRYELAPSQIGLEGAELVELRVRPGAM